MQEKTPPVYQDEITLKELILKVQEYFREVVRGWWIIGLVCLCTTTFYLYKHFTFIPAYKAELRFVVEGQGGGGGRLSSILGSFGVKKGGKLNPYKILEIGKSSKLFEDVAFSIFNEDTTIAEKILTEYSLVDKWSDNNERFKNFYFVNDEMNRRIEKEVFKRLRKVVWGSPKNKENALSKLDLDEDRGIYSLITSTTDEDLSIAITNKFYKGIKKFFEDEVFENQKRSAEILALKSDSIKRLRTSKIYELARFEDRNQGLLYKENASKRAILTQEIQVLSIAYGELVKNYEMTDVNLKDLQPLFMEIDRPFSPLQPNSSSLFKSLIIGLFLGGFLGVMLLVLRKIFKDIMK